MGKSVWSRRGYIVRNQPFSIHLLTLKVWILLLMFKFSGQVKAPTTEVAGIYEANAIAAQGNCLLRDSSSQI